MNPPRSAGDCRHEIQLTAMVPVELPVTLPVLCNLACRNSRQSKESVPAKTEGRIPAEHMERSESEREPSMDKQGGVVPRTVGEDDKGRSCWHANAAPADTLPPLLQEIVSQCHTNTISSLHAT